VRWARLRTSSATTAKAAAILGQPAPLHGSIQKPAGLVCSAILRITSQYPTVISFGITWDRVPMCWTGSLNAAGQVLDLLDGFFYLKRAVVCAHRWRFSNFLCGRVGVLATSCTPYGNLR